MAQKLFGAQSADLDSNPPSNACLNMESGQSMVLWAVLTIVLAKDREELSLRQTSYSVVVALVHRWSYETSLLADAQDLLHLVCVEV